MNKADDDVRERLIAAAKRAGYDMAELSRAIGRDKGYLRDFVRKGSPRKLAENDRHKLSAILGVDESVLRTTNSLATRHEIPLTGKRRNVIMGSGVLPIMPQINDLPILGRVKEIGGSLFIVGSEPGGYIMRPPELVGVEDAYAVEVPDNTMFPAFKAAHYAKVHPGRYPQPSDDVVVRLKDDTAIIRTLKKRGEGFIIVEQYNPPKDTRIAEADIKAIHRIVDSTR